MRASDAARPYARQGHDPARRAFEEPLLARLLAGLLRAAGGDELLDLGCGDGLAGRLAGPRLGRYLGVDLSPPPAAGFLAHDLRDGLGPVGRRPFDVYLGGFGIASHLPPAALRRLLAEIAAHARPGALVALEGLGLRSLEWPGVWSAPPGAARTLPYRLATDVSVHPWAPDELLRLLDDAGIEPLRAVDRTVQCPPKASEARYWPGMPALRRGLNALLEGGEPRPATDRDDLARALDGRDPPLALDGGEPPNALDGGEPPHALTAPLPPLPAGDAALVHHALAARRRELIARSSARGAALARSIWSLEPATAGGYGHGLLVIGRVR
jgi:SAM-dependent methyltransferase